MRVSRYLLSIPPFLSCDYVEMQIIADSWTSEGGEGRRDSRNVGTATGTSTDRVTA